MIINKDYHIHTKLCKHAQGEMYEYVEKAIDHGLKEIAFTDHIPLPDSFDIAHRMREEELEAYCKSIQTLQQTYPEISILCGIEADYYEGFEEYLSKTIDRFSFDLVIMSVHFIKDWPANNWVFSYYFPDHTLSQIYSEYTAALSKAIETKLFDIVGHFDLIKSPDASLLEKNGHEVDNLLKLIKQNDMTVEINTSGMRKHIDDLFPEKKIIERIIQQGISITIGSDAHQPNHVGFYFLELSNYLDSFKTLQLASYSKRTRSLESITNM
jgi:histidinol-phosphatase (PHP family)